MYKIRNLIFIIGLFFIYSCNAQNNSKGNWESDLDYLKKELPKRHYDLFTIKSKRKYLTGIEKIKEEQKNLSNIEIALKLQQLIASFGDSHTKIKWELYIDKSQILPLHLYWFSDGLYILHTTKENQEILGHQITKINDFSIKTISDSLSTLLTIDNQAIVKSYIPKMLPIIQLLIYFGFAENELIQLELEDSYGHTKTYSIQPAYMDRKNRKMFEPDSLALCYKNERAFFIDYYQQNDKIYYLQYNKCWSKELEIKYANGKNANRLPSFKEFEDKVFSVLKKQEVEKLVVDLRFNGGGNSEQGTDFARKIADFEKNNKDIKIYVVLGRFTFSSAILNAIDFAKITNAIFVGEKTGGKPNHFGEVRKFSLPNSGLKVYYSTKYFKRTDGELNTLSPDILMESSFKDFKKGIDPIYEWIKKQ